MASKNNYYVTTPIYYVNSKPHLGTLYSTLLADVASRFAQLMGKQTFFMTGTDEHGQKIQERAQELGMPPKEFVDSMISPFKDIWKLFDLNYNKFMRTTDEYHQKAVQAWIKQLMEQGDIYKSTYDGSYCVPCESFMTVTSDSPRNESGKAVCALHPNRILEEVSEESYFFRLSSYEKLLLEFYEKNPKFIMPRERMAEVVSFVKSGLKDLSISRKNLTWGVPFPGDPEHVVYVWGDALNNYITGIGYGQSDEESMKNFNQWWPADLHVMAKDIVRFHAIYWPAFLMASGLELPKRLLVHGYILMGDQKMSKSLGNAVDPTTLAEWYGVEPVRYYLMRQMAVTHDGIFSLKDLEDRITADLANNLGNLLNRTLSLALGNKLEKVKAPVAWEPAASHLREQAEETYRSYWDAMNDNMYHVALGHVWTFIGQVNAYFHAQKPWVLAKENGELFQEVIAAACQSLEIIGIMLSPFMPSKMSELLSCLGKRLESEYNYDEILRTNSWNGQFELKKLSEPLFIRPESRVEKSDQPELKKEKNRASMHVLSKKEASDSSGEITINDFVKCHLTVGSIRACEPVKGSNKMLKLTVDVGEESGDRTILSGVAQHFNPDDLIGKQGVYVTNLAPRKMMGEVSQGMMLFAEDDEGKLKLVTVGGQVKPGTRLR